ncbi:hypothetical protein E4T52_02086 [Aureobasidium sp. EXF-3400]|nr:hypothetical protein E4T51_02031 [Aureobasidium sp. EXF-12344]KAI4782945.1 hypothetical protein E4T52_02086 [Aureobasidium sp. EXF-3400]
MVSAEPFEQLANRPPTPPKDVDHEINQAISLLDVDFEPEVEQVRPACSRSGTPVQPSPPSSQGEGSRHKSSKRVEFSPCVTAHDPTPFYATSAGTASPLPRRFPSSKQPRPVRSILKASLDLQTPTPDAASPAPDYFSISDPKTFPVMLDSVLKFLDAPSTALRLDGYSTLNGALKAYDDLPDVDAMRSKLPSLVKYISRDILESSRKPDPMTSNLTTQALKLTTAILMLPALADALDEQFETLLVDRAIEILEQDPVPKSIANHHMFLLATQRFPSRVMTLTKVERIVSSLTTIHERVSGNSVIASRLVIFQRLMDQATATMLASMRDWMPHIFHGVLSSIKDVRVRAIETGMQAAMMYGKSYSSTKVIIDLFHTATAEGSTYGAYFTARLFDMSKPKEGGENTDLEEAVPQIWSMVVLFFRSKKVKLSQWRLFCEEWFLLIQNCLNSKNITVKFRATCAWNRLVYVANPDREMLEKMEGWDHTLRVPFVHILHTNKGRDKKSKEVRHIALSGYCNLLHYALRPSQPWHDLDYFWDLYVKEVLLKLLLAGGRDASLACRVLKALFDGKSSVWDEEVANKAPILPEALPRLDSKWVRSRAQKILELLGPFLELSLAQSGDGRGIDGTPWREFLTAIASAGSHEVLRSQELKECLAQLMNLYGRLWAKALKSVDHLETPWISRFAALVQCSIEIVGPLPFSEENLARSESKNFEAAPTPSNRSSKHHARLQSPAVFLFDLFAQPPLTISTDIAYSDAARGLLHQICQGRNSRKERLELVRKCSQSSLASTSALLWTTAVQETTAVLLDSTLNESVQEPARLGHQARHAISILASGLHHKHEESGALAAAFELVSVLTRILKQEAGEGGVVLGLMEPLAEALLQRRDEIISKPVFVQFSEKVLRVGAFPRNKQQMDEARRSLWNTHPPLSKQSSFEPFNHVYELANSALLISYVSIEETAQCLAQFIAAVQDFLSKCPLSLFASPALRRVQHGLSLVIKDEGRVIAGSKETQEVFSKVLALWQSILAQLKNLPSNKTLLKGLDELFAAGLNSTHRDIINLTVSFWNTTFGQLDSLEYPSQVEEAMRRLRPLVELDLPTFPENDDASAPSPLRDLIESQQDMNVQETPSPIKQQPIRRSKRTSVLNRAISSSPQSEKATTRRQPTSKGALKSKLRHNDSQVEFTAVESSSPVAMESQLLTEHQREVRSRQQFETAPLYPEFSSSPGPRRRASKSGLPLLDFSNQQAGTENGYATPTLNDDHGPMDEYITSSPTPKAAEKLQPAAVQNTDLVESAPEAEEDNIPSSPPEMADEEMGDETVYEGTTEIENLQTVEQQGLSHSRFDTVPEDFSTIVPQEETRVDDSKALSEKAPTVEQVVKVHVQAHPSIKRLAQNLEGGISSDVFTDAHSELNIENSNMDDPEKSSQVAGGELGGQNAIESADSSPIPFADSLVQQLQEEAEDSADASAHKTAATPGDISRVLDSFIGNTPDEDDTASAKEETQPNSALKPNPALSASKRKREEPQEARGSAKRRKSSASPFRRMMTRAYSFVTGSQVEKEDDDDDDDEEVQDCIVVGSQRDQEDKSQSEPAENSPIPESAPASVAPATVKRGRGRPRKSTTPVSAPVSSVRTRTSKRRASTLEGEGNEESAIIDTPAPIKSRRTTRSQDAKTGQPVEHVMLSPTHRRRGRELEAVLVSPRPSGESSLVEESLVDDAVIEEWEEDGNDDDQEADSQLKHEAEKATHEQPRTQASWVIARLQDLIINCATLVVGPQEEREISDALYVLGRNIYEARRRSGN